MRSPGTSRATSSCDQVEALKAEHEVISTRLFAGRTVVHVLSDSPPGEGFDPVEGGLEDVYFATLSGVRRRREAA